MSLLLLFGGQGVPPPAAPAICYPTSAQVTRLTPDSGASVSRSDGTTSATVVYIPTSALTVYNPTSASITRSSTSASSGPSFP